MITPSTRVVPGLAALAAAALLAACTTGPEQGTRATPTSSPGGGTSSPTTSATASPGASADLGAFYGQKLTWKGCSGSFECTSLTVPLDYSDPSGQTIQISVIRLPATDEAHRLGSLLINPGGPGASGVDYARAARAVIDAPVRKVYDVVGFDPRGVGRSDPVQCLDDKQTDTFMATDGTPDTAAEVTRLEKVSKGFVDACEAHSAALLPHIGTEDAARDIDVLRAALGDDKLTWLGTSYGTLLGATYADLFPDRVGRMVLDSAVDPSLDNTELTHGQAKGFEGALHRFAADCATQSDCPLPRSEQAGVDRIQQFLDDLDSSPLPTGDKARPLTQSLGQQAILSYLYYPAYGDWEQLRYGLRLAFEGDGSLLLSMLDERNDRASNGKYRTNPYSSFLSVLAVDYPDRPTPAQSQELAVQWAKEDPVFGSAFAWGNLLFGYWPVAATRTPHEIKAPGTGPIVVIGSTYDPATPYPWAQSLARQLDNGVLLTRVGDGHGAYGSGSSCIDRAVDAYLVSGTVPSDGTVCH